MPTSAWYQGESVKRLLQGAAVGVVATLAIGFGWGGWMLGSSAKTLADSMDSSAVVSRRWRRSVSISFNIARTPPTT